MLIQLKDVTKTFKAGGEKLNALNNVNLSINKGELVSIIGPSGAGKTTLAQIIGGLVRPTSGEVIVAGKTLNFKRDKEISAYRNQQVGFVFQNYSLLPQYSALENVMLPLMLAKEKPSARKVKAEEFLRAVGLQDRMNYRANQLSGGQRQRVSIARALAMNPSIIIADEPTGNLDSRKGEEIMSIFRHLSKRRNITIIIVTHDDTIARMADRTIQIKDGHLSEVTHAL
ncbi:hypothetical protein CYG49_02475 [Candidatus Saccharibacteria bacterium]|nr:MAG: hypothetical protein CYG49_02475 [Candidatus Saccharibacteria bacterium]